MKTPETWPDVDSSLKLCKDCKHSRDPHGEYECHHPESDGWIISLVTGKTVHNSGSSKWKSYCEVSRGYGVCGKEGKFFEAKVVVPRRSFLKMISDMWDSDWPTGSGGC
jgi:hypothetical protein